MASFWFIFRFSLHHIRSTHKKRQPRQVIVSERRKGHGCHTRTETAHAAPFQSRYSLPFTFRIIISESPGRRKRNCLFLLFFLKSAKECFPILPLLSVPSLTFFLLLDKLYMIFFFMLIFSHIRKIFRHFVPPIRRFGQGAGRSACPFSVGPASKMQR